MAHKKAAGSVKNLKDSQPKYRGVKVFWGQPVVAGNIIIRQKGSKYECGKNTYEAADFSILAEKDWVVAFKKKNFKKFFFYICNFRITFNSFFIYKGLYSL